MLIAYDGKLLECESLIELRGELPDQDWRSMVEDTIKFYCNLQAAIDTLPAADPEDFATVRDLQKTIQFLKGYDPSTMVTFNIEDIVKKNTEVMKESMRIADELMNVHKSNGHSVNVSKL